ncbi:putative MFS transporter, AGZA family, xanthine/uracil permease [Clostridium cavendishii DSM 21758]|uniref:Putative MFS transporter, AGZA family, xanthine/uracil permease n=1 Tax=Clostridium cavendishii DSM 21758 TaxID=1121302 RepID=A0A1M6PN82_9CLOT|nr:NCS2 family permease [Clostridium cavendishii]SHK09373.1 putative MFS transporter, AGZA family, xanthine/uracil permease [Clostridium cavendishii DSM 21758]
MKNLFKLKENNTNFKNELTAALTSFFASVYIIVVNASILSDAGMSIDAQIIATVLASLVGCLLIAFISNTPLIIMPGMGVNALFTYTIVRAMGLNYHQALAAVVIAGLLFSVIALTPLANILSNSIPHSLKEAITVGIGLFITFIGLQKAGLIVSSSSTLVGLGKLTDPHVLAFLITMVITLFLFLKDVPGAFLISIFLGTLISIMFGIVNLSSLKFGLPNFSGYNDLFFAMDFGKISTIPFWVATFSLTLVLVFENIGLLHGQVAGMLKQPEKINKSLIATALSTIGCGLLGTSPSVSTVEGAAGIAAGGKTGLTSFLTGLLFLVSLFFIPLITIIPSAAISPILVIIGGLMMKNIVNINFEDFSESFPAFLTIVLIPLTYSIVDGIAFGFIAYPLAKLFTKKYKEVSLPMYIVSIIFLTYFILHGLNL